MYSLYPNSFPDNFIPNLISPHDSVRLHSEYNLEALVWCLALGVFLLRFMTLGTKINRKYRNLSVLITEQSHPPPPHPSNRTKDNLRQEHNIDETCSGGHMV
ncbi:unnamed protein product [Timema podura]|uniref:Uncharacterized protein n=1 Tax=Timema podura TaxID=61482 RepID=A0ABN7NS71_TIMPD|nr:unnamed protein product [Timema podura]